MALQISNGTITRGRFSGDCDDQEMTRLTGNGIILSGLVGDGNCGFEDSLTFDNSALQIRVTPNVWTLQSGSDIKYEFILKQGGMYYTDRDITTGEYKLGFAASSRPDMNIEDWNNGNDVFSNFAIKDGSDYTSSHLHFYNGTSSLTLSYDDDILPATSASSGPPHYIDFNLSSPWLKNVDDNTNYNFISDATSLVATASVKQPTIFDYPITYNADRSNAYFYDEPTYTHSNLYFISESFDGTIGNWYSTTSLATQALKEMKEDMTLEMYEAACEGLKESYSKKIDEMKEAWNAEGEEFEVED